MRQSVIDTQFKPMMVPTKTGGQAFLVVTEDTTEAGLQDGTMFPFAVTHSEHSAVLISNALNEYLAA